jgi:phage baseplate assembly protein W|tara:strand:+ start:37 stop:441 length:405 start_codon:yes stop_codon:yes gene_type:complete
MPEPKRKISRIYKDIDLSFTANALTGDIGKKLDVNAVKQSMKNLLFIHPFERKFHPEIGSPLNKMLFENMAPGTEKVLQKIIQQLLENFEPRVRMESIIVKPDYDNNLYSILIKFFVVGTPEPQQLALNLSRLR